jgi:hypothetical protein
MAAKVAWAYYINNQDGEAFALASSIGDGSAPMSGAWVAEERGSPAFRPGASTIA